MCWGLGGGRIMLANAHGDLVVEAATQTSLIGHVQPPEAGGVGHFVMETARSLSLPDVGLDGRFTSRPDAYR